MTGMKMGGTQMETGAPTIDVSAYPKAVQDSYRLFTEKRAQCHRLNHTINSDHHALPSEWESIVSRMWRKPGSPWLPPKKRKPPKTRPRKSMRSMTNNSQSRSN